MTDALTLFPPHQAEATRRLAKFAPLTGGAYAMRRNFDYGSGMHRSVSTLSPYVRLRMLDEVRIGQATLAAHSAEAANKFLSEVFWRTYWKGWMELRPGVWDSYVTDVNRLANEVQTQSGLRARWEDACLGQTGIAPFDAWATELVQTGYLHNHARMWFASIWVFTLELPWQLGADFFLRHLLDGDAAVNTLSWRWVAGRQTRGKTYLARPDNIEKFTNGRFSGVIGLAPDAPLPDFIDPPAPRALPHIAELQQMTDYAVLLHDDDTNLAPLINAAAEPHVIAYLDNTSALSPWQMAPHVSAFRHAAAKDAIGQDHAILAGIDALAAWATATGAAQIVTPYAPVGITRILLDAYAARADALPVIEVRSKLETDAWPLATKGFFPFRKNIPRLIDTYLR